MANQLFRRVLRSFTCAGFFSSTNIRVLSWNPGTIWVCFFLLELEIFIRWGAHLRCKCVFNEEREKAEREKSRWYIAIPTFFRRISTKMCTEKKLSVKPCKADWGQIIENPSLRLFLGFKRPVSFFFYKICGLEFFFCPILNEKGGIWYSQGLDRDWIIGTGFCRFPYKSVAYKAKEMETSQQPATNPTETNTGVYTFRRPNPKQWVSRGKKKSLESVYVEKRKKK